MLILAVSELEVTALRAPLTVIFGPKLTEVGVGPKVVKCVNCPVIVTERLFTFWGECDGVMLVRTAGVLVTQNGAVTISVPVVRVTFRLPGVHRSEGDEGAVGEITNFALAVVKPVTWKFWI